MLIAVIGVWRALVIESHRVASLNHSISLSMYSDEKQSNWREKLNTLINFPTKDLVVDFIKNNVYKSMKEVEKELENKDWNCKIEYDEEYIRAIIVIFKNDDIKFTYEVRLREYELPDFVEQKIDQKKQKYYYNAEVFLKRGGLYYDLYGYDENTIINDIITQFEKYLRFVHTSPGTLPWDMSEHDELLNDSRTNK